MTSKRARGAGMRVRNSLANGPRRAQSKESIRVFCDEWHALVAADIKVSEKRTEDREIKVAPRIRFIRP